MPNIKYNEKIQRNRKIKSLKKKPSLKLNELVELVLVMQEEIDELKKEMK